MGGALRAAQEGGKIDSARPMKGILRDVVEVREDDDDGTHRMRYTVEIGDVVYVLDFFQKKSTKGIGTPKVILDRIERRFKFARANHQAQEAHRNG